MEEGISEERFELVRTYLLNYTKLYPQTLSERLGSAVESARLYEETRRRAEREQLTSEIIAKMRATNDPRTILQTAAFELRKALNVDRAQLLVKTHLL